MRQTPGFPSELIDKIQVYDRAGPENDECWMYTGEGSIGFTTIELGEKDGETITAIPISAGLLDGNIFSLEEQAAAITHEPHALTWRKANRIKGKLPATDEGYHKYLGKKAEADKATEEEKLEAALMDRVKPMLDREVTSLPFVISKEIAEYFPGVELAEGAVSSLGEILGSTQSQSRDMENVSGVDNTVSPANSTKLKSDAGSILVHTGAAGATADRVVRMIRAALSAGGIVLDEGTELALTAGISAGVVSASSDVTGIGQGRLLWWDGCERPFEQEIKEATGLDVSVTTVQGTGPADMMFVEKGVWGFLTYDPRNKTVVVSDGIWRPFLAPGVGEFEDEERLSMFTLAAGSDRALNEPASQEQAELLGYLSKKLSHRELFDDAEMKHIGDGGAGAKELYDRLMVARGKEAIDVLDQLLRAAGITKKAFEYWYDAIRESVHSGDTTHKAEVEVLDRIEKAASLSQFSTFDDSLQGKVTALVNGALDVVARGTLTTGLITSIAGLADAKTTVHMPVPCVVELSASGVKLSRAVRMLDMGLPFKPKEQKSWMLRRQESGLVQRSAQRRLKLGAPSIPAQEKRDAQPPQKEALLLEPAQQMPETGLIPGAPQQETPALKMQKDGLPLENTKRKAETGQMKKAEPIGEPVVINSWLDDGRLVLAGNGECFFGYLDQEGRCALQGSPYIKIQGAFGLNNTNGEIPVLHGDVFAGAAAEVYNFDEMQGGYRREPVFGDDQFYSWGYYPRRISCAMNGKYRGKFAVCGPHGTLNVEVWWQGQRRLEPIKLTYFGGPQVMTDFYALEWSHDGKRLAVCGDKGEVWILERNEDRTWKFMKLEAQDESGKAIGEFARTRITQSHWSPDGRLLVSGEMKGDKSRAWILDLRNTAGYQVKAHLLTNTHGQPLCSVSDAAWSGDNRLAIGGSTDRDGAHSVYVYAPGETTYEVQQVALPGADKAEQVRSLAFSKSNRLGVVGYHDVVIENVPDKVWVLNLKGDGVFANTVKLEGVNIRIANLSWSPDGRWLCGSGSASAANIWEVGPLAELAAQGRLENTGTAGDRHELLANRVAGAAGVGSQVLVTAQTETNESAATSVKPNNLRMPPTADSTDPQISIADEQLLQKYLAKLGKGPRLLFEFPNMPLLDRQLNKTEFNEWKKQRQAVWSQIYVVVTSLPCKIMDAKLGYGDRIRYVLNETFHNSCDAIFSNYDARVLKNSGVPVRPANYVGKIWVDVSVVGNNLVFKVMDNGLGIYAANTNQKKNLRKALASVYFGDLGEGLDNISKYVADKSLSYEQKLAFSQEDRKVSETVITVPLANVTFVQESLARLPSLQAAEEDYLQEPIGTKSSLSTNVDMRDDKNGKHEQSLGVVIKSSAELALSAEGVRQLVAGSVQGAASLIALEIAKQHPKPYKSFTDPERVADSSPEVVAKLNKLIDALRDRGVSEDIIAKIQVYPRDGPEGYIWTDEGSIGFAGALFDGTPQHNLTLLPVSEGLFTRYPNVEDQVIAILHEPYAADWRRANGWPATDEEYHKELLGGLSKGTLPSEKIREAELIKDVEDLLNKVIPALPFNVTEDIAEYFPGAKSAINTEKSITELLKLVKSDTRSIGVDTGAYPVIPGYRITGKAGSGTTAIVYSATESATGLKVAAKVARSTCLEKSKPQLETESKFFAMSTSGRFPRLITHGVTKLGEPYEIMGFVAGKTLEKWIYDNRKATGTAYSIRCLSIIFQIVQALQEAHVQHNVIYRDLKPSNVMVEDIPGGAVKVTLVDAGLVTAVGEPQDGSGTYAFSAPEQQPGSIADLRFDFFPAGLLLFRLLIHNDWALSDLRKNMDLVRLDEGLKRELTNIIEKAVAQQPKDRYHNDKEFLDEVDQALALARRIESAETAWADRYRFEHPVLSHLPILGTYLMRRIVANSVNPVSSQKTTRLTTGETVKNYIVKHSAMRFIYTHNILWLGRGFVIACVSISRSELGASVAELGMFAEAIAARLTNDNTAYNKLVLAHKPEGMSEEDWLQSAAKEKVESGFLALEAKLLRNFPGVTPAAVLTNKIVHAWIVETHRKHNLAVLMNFKLHIINLGRILTLRKPLPYGLLTTNGEDKSNAVAQDLAPLVLPKEPEISARMSNLKKARVLSEYILLLSDLFYQVCPDGKSVYVEKVVRNTSISVMTNFSQWIGHGVFDHSKLIQILSYYETDGYKIFEHDDLESLYKDIRDHVQAISDYAQDDSFLKNYSIPDVSKYTKENPMSRSQAVMYFLNEAFGGSSPEAAQRYARFKRIVAQMEKVEPDFEKYIQAVIADYNNWKAAQTAATSQKDKSDTEISTLSNVSYSSVMHVSLFDKALKDLEFVYSDSVERAVKDGLDRTATEKGNPDEVTVANVRFFKVWSGVHRIWVCAREQHTGMRAVLDELGIEYWLKYDDKAQIVISQHSLKALSITNPERIARELDSALDRKAADDKTPNSVVLCGVRFFRVQAGKWPRWAAERKEHDAFIKLGTNPGSPVQFIVKENRQPENEAVSLDFHNVPAAKLREIIQSYHAVTTDDNGGLHTNIYLLDAPTPDMESWDWHNTGMVVNGNPVWFSAKANALVLFSEGAQSSEVAARIAMTMTDRNGVKEGRLIRQAFERLGREQEIDLSARGYQVGIRIDHSAPGETVNYINGEMVVSAGYFEAGGKTTPGRISLKLGGLEKFRKAESKALQQEIYIGMDDVNDFNGLLEELALFDRAGSGQMVVKAAVFDGKSETQIRAVTDLARRAGIKIMINTVQGCQRDWQSLGFAGYYDGRKMYDFTAKPEGDSADEIGDFKTPDVLKSKLAGSNAAYKIVTWSNLKGLLAERSIVERVAIGEILKTSVLGLYRAETTLTENYVRDVGYNLERDALPTVINDSALADAVKSGSVEEIQEALQINGQEHVVNAYLAKLAGDIGGKNQQKLKELQLAFLTAVVEKALSKSKLDSVGKTDGLADQGFEITLGQKLLKQKQDNTAGPVDVKTLTMFAGLEKEKLAGEFFRSLSTKVTELNARKDPEAINTVIELIAARAETKIRFDKDSLQTKFDAEAVTAVLEAG